MARRLSTKCQADSCERLARFRDWTGTSTDLCWHEGNSRSSLSLWSRRLRVPMVTCGNDRSHRPHLSREISRSIDFS
jgi:hypothetical protein